MAHASARRTLACITLALALAGGCGPAEVSVSTTAGAETETAESGGATPAPLTGPDADEDGVPDRVDRCVTVAGEPHAGGCPPFDEDHDGEPEAWVEYTCEDAVCHESMCVRETPSLPVVYFAAGRTEPAGNAIDALADALNAHAAGDVYVLGHSEESEAEDLALRRAEAVIDALARRGVTRERLQPVAFGAHWGKLDPPEGMTPEAADRRVETQATWHGPAGCDQATIPGDKCPIPCG